MIELTRPAKKSKPELVALFAIDGTEYRVPAKPRVNVSLQYLNDVREHGELTAQMLLLEKLLGAEGYKALSEYDDLTSEQLGQVMDYAAKLALGSLESSQGNG